MNIPFMDLQKQYLSIQPEIDQAIQNVLASCEFIGGPAKTLFEENFARACGVKGCLGVGNGTDAIYLALMAMGVGLGDEVVVPALTFIATSEAVSVCGAKPIFVDVDEKTFLMDIEKLSGLLKTGAKSRGGKIKAIIPVHLYGRICDMTQIMQLAAEYDVLVLEDSAQAHLAEWQGKRTGGHGHMATFSFYPGKNLGAYGDAGAIVSNDLDLLTKAKKLANHGRVSKYDHEIEGFNSRIDGLQAAVLDVKLRYLEDWTNKRYEAALRYDEMLKPLAGQVVLPEVPPRGQRVFHLYVIQVKNRDQVQKNLEASGVQTIVHYPIALPNLKAYASYGHKPSDFPVASRMQNQILSLPLFPEITREQQAYVAEALKKAVR